MNTDTLNGAALRELKRPEIQKLAKREGIRATGKKDDMIAALVAKYPGGVQPLEKEQGPARRSKRHNTTQVKEGEKSEKLEIKEDEHEPAVHGDSISQYVPARPSNKNKPTTEDGVAIPSPHRGMPALPSPLPPQSEQDIPAPRPATKISAPQGSQRGVRASHVSQAALHEPVPEFIQGSSKPVDQPAQTPLLYAHGLPPIPTAFMSLSGEEITSRQPRASTSRVPLAIRASSSDEENDSDKENEEREEDEEGEDDEDDEDDEEVLLDSVYDLIPSSPEYSDDDKIMERCYSTVLKQFADFDPDSDSDSGSEVDEEDQRLAALEAETKTQAGAAPAGTRSVKGATGSQARRIVFDARQMAGEMRGVRTKRRGMARELAFLEAQEEMLKVLRFEMDAKRLALEEVVITKLKAVDSGWLNGTWIPPTREFKHMQSHAFGEKFQNRMNAMQDEDSDWEDSQEIVEVLEVAEERDDRFSEDNEPDELDVPVLGPAFVYRPASAQRRSDSSSSLPPSSPPTSELFAPALPTFQHELVTPPRRAQRGAPAPTQEGSDDFEDSSSSKSSGNTTRPKALHPTEAIDRAAARGAQVGGFQQAGVPRASPPGMYANPPPTYGVAAPWYNRRAHAEVGYPYSYLGKRRRDEEDLDENAAGPSTRKITAEDWASAIHENGSTSRLADPQPAQTAYVPRPAGGYNGATDRVSGSPEPEPDYPYAEEYTRPPAHWRDFLGRRSAPSPPKRLRREGW